MMQRGAKVAVWVLVLAGLGFAQWKYNAAQQLLNAVHPQPAGTTQTSGSTSTPQKGGSGKRAAQPVAVKLVAAAPKDFPLIERSYGTMASPQIVPINARLASQIIDVPVKDGQYVKKGDTLVVLDDRTVQANLAKDQATLSKDAAALINANAALDRAQTLFTKGAGTKQDLDTAVAAQKAAQQTLDADKAVIDADKLQLDFAKITAPFDGKLGAISAVPGALVTANTVGTPGLMTITQMQPLKVDFRLPEQVLPAMRSKMSNGTDITAANVTVRVYASNSKELLDTGKLSFIDSSVDVSSGTIGLAADMGNSKLTLWPGERVNVEMEYGSLAGAVTVPSVAVQQGQIGSYVWLVDDQNKVKATPVKVARYEGNDAAISDGLALGQQVVVEGQAKLSNGAEIRTGKPADSQGQAKPADPKPADEKTAANAPQAASGAEAATPDAATPKRPKSNSGDAQQ